MKFVLRIAAFLGVAAAASSAFADEGGNWPMYNRDPAGTRANNEETVLSPTTVSGLHVQWAFRTDGLVTATPVVVDGMVYAGDATGAFYAVNPDGTLKWRAQASTSITASAIVVGNRVVVGDLAGYIFGFERNTGALKWTVQPINHPLAAIWGSATRVGSNIAIGVASNEEPAAAGPGYPCCSTIGAVLLIEPVKGKVIWQTNMITAAEDAAGSSGAAVWSTPTYDAQLGLVFVTTGNNFSYPSTSTSDAIIALDAKTGAIAWSNQRWADDVWNYTYSRHQREPRLRLRRLAAGVHAAGRTEGRRCRPEERFLPRAQRRHRRGDFR